jgi:hypothetical protein
LVPFEGPAIQPSPSSVNLLSLKGLSEFVLYFWSFAPLGDVSLVASYP